MPFVAKAGAYDRRVNVYKQTTSPTINADGQAVESGSLICRRWASVLPVTGNEKTMVGQNQADITHTVRLRSDSVTRTITPKMWLTLGDGTRLDIRAAFDVDMRRVEIQLDCNQRI